MSYFLYVSRIANDIQNLQNHITNIRPLNQEINNNNQNNNAPNQAIRSANLIINQDNSQIIFNLYQSTQNLRETLNKMKNNSNKISTKAILEYLLSNEFMLISLIFSIYSSLLIVKILFAKDIKILEYAFSYESVLYNSSQIPNLKFEFILFLMTFNSFAWFLFLLINKMFFYNGNFKLLRIDLNHFLFLTLCSPFSMILLSLLYASKKNDPKNSTQGIFASTNKNSVNNYINLNYQNHDFNHYLINDSDIFILTLLANINFIIIFFIKYFTNLYISITQCLNDPNSIKLYFPKYSLAFENNIDNNVKLIITTKKRILSMIIVFLLYAIGLLVNLPIYQYIFLNYNETNILSKEANDMEVLINIEKIRIIFTIINKSLVCYCLFYTIKGISFFFLLIFRKHFNDFDFINEDNCKRYIFVESIGNCILQVT